MNQRDLYKALNASDDEDILRHFPTRYEDLHATALPDDIKDGYRGVFKGSVFGLRNLPNRGNSFIRFFFKTTLGKSISCILYNQPFYLSKLSSGKELLIVAYYSEARKSFMVYSILDLDSEFVLTGLKPVYTLPKSVSQSFFQNYVKKLLAYPREATYATSVLPTRLIEKYRLMNEFDAYKAVHIPMNEKNLKDGLRVFKFEEALSYSLRALSIKKDADQQYDRFCSIDLPVFLQYDAQHPQHKHPCGSAHIEQISYVWHTFPVHKGCGSNQGTQIKDTIEHIIA